MRFLAYGEEDLVTLNTKRGKGKPRRRKGQGKGGGGSADTEAVTPQLPLSCCLPMRGEN